MGDIRVIISKTHARGTQKREVLQIQTLEEIATTSIKRTTGSDDMYRHDRCFSYRPFSSNKVVLYPDPCI